MNVYRTKSAELEKLRIVIPFDEKVIIYVLLHVLFINHIIYDIYIYTATDTSLTIVYIWEHTAKYSQICILYFNSKAYS